MFIFFCKFCDCQPIDEHILRELEKIEKESEIDEILSYRSTAESKLQVRVVFI